MVSLRRELHRHPELSGHEEETAQRIAARLAALGLEAERVGGTGLRVDIRGERDGPVIALRADTDALPIQEETGLSFASENEGVMHACGHDAHSSMLYGAAQLLVRSAPPPLPVRLLWQPAEEKGVGALALIEAGALENVAMIFGGHVDRRFDAGTLVVTDGPVNASTDVFLIDVFGQQGHGARPHEATDTVVVGSLLVTAIQTIVSREVDPSHPSVVSVGSFRAGTAPNVIAGHARLEGTVRAQGEKVRTHLLDSIRRIALAVGNLHGASVEVEIRRGTPPLENEPAMAAIAREAARDIVGPEHVKPLRTANMGGEDFAWYLEHVEGCYIRYGTRVAGLEGHPAHSSRFDIDEHALGTGAAWLDRVARVAAARVLERGGS
ncbi:MAG: amidohydrolase [bacterium]|nr:amidohydrolase [bacterium]